MSPEQRECIIERHNTAAVDWAAAWESGESEDWAAAFKSEAAFINALDELIA